MVELVVLAGGFGTRLRSAVSDVPKPLAPVCGRPFLSYLIENWTKQGVSKMTFLLHHEHQLIEKFLASDPLLAGCTVEVMVEDVPLGTGGALAALVHSGNTSDNFLVANADTWLGTGIAALSETEPPCLCTIDVPDCGRYGGLSIEHGRVTSFREKQVSTGPGPINAGLYHLTASAFASWEGGNLSLEGDVFPVWVDQRKLRAIPLETSFIDIGIPQDYLRFQQWIEAGKSGVL